MRGLQEKYLKFVARCSRGPYTSKTGQLDVTDWTRATRRMYINEKRTCKARKIIALF